MARRALIIGLGSNGYDACNWLVQRIQWEYGGLEKTPWLKVLCLETAEVTRSGPLGDNSLHIKIDEGDFAALRDSPGRYADTLDLERWTDSRTLGVPSAITNGAMNIRMMGRLAFLFSKNLERIRSEVKDRLDALASLTESDAKRLRGILPDGSDPSVDLSDQVSVYVVGTLAGGTCSGAFIDLGYFLYEEFKNIGAYNIARTGIFALPHPGYDPQQWRRRRANVFAALTELNHFSTPGKTYSAQYPIRPGRRTVIPKTLPYDNCYLVQPSGATDDDYNRLKVTVAQYLYTDVFAEQGSESSGGKKSERDAARVDVSDETDKPDLKGSPQQFFTFGMSAIEFPAYLVAQACCYKICHEAFAQWLAPRDLSPTDLDVTRRKTLSLSPEIISAMLLDSDGASFEKKLRDALDNALGGKISVAELEQFEEIVARSVRDAPAGSVDAHSGDASLPAGAIAGHVKGRRFAPVLAAYKTSIAGHIQENMVNIATGPDYCRRLLDSLEAWLAGRIGQVSSAQAKANRDSAIDSSYGNLEARRGKLAACLHDQVLGFMGAGVGRSMAVKKHAAEYESAAQDYITWRLKGLIEPEEGRAWEECLAWVRVLQSRVSAPEVGITAQGEALRDLFAERLKSLDETVPAINGKALFEPGKTVSQTYDSVWSRKPAEEREGAKRELVAAWSALPQVDANTGRMQDAATYFQATLVPATPAQRSAALERGLSQISPRARRHFGEVFGISVFDRINPSDTDTIRDVFQKSRVMLDLGTHLNDRYENTGTKSIGLAFFEGADTVGAGGDSKPRLFWDEVRRVKQGDEPLRAVASRARQSIVFVQEKAAFSLPIIRGLREGEASFEDDFRNQVQQVTIHARRDVAQWEPFYGSLDPQSPRRKALFLLGIALARPEATPSGATPDGAANGYAGGPASPALTQHIVRRVAQPAPGAEYVYDLNPPLPPRTTEMSFPSNIKDAASRLRSLPEVQRRLEEDVLKARQVRGAKAIVQEILQFTSGIGRLGLQDDDAFVDENRAFELITPFWRSDAEITRVFEDMYRPDESVLDRMWQAARPGFPYAGYYCECADHPFLGQHKSDIPERCPRCSRYLRWTGLQSRS